MEDWAGKVTVENPSNRPPAPPKEAVRIEYLEQTLVPPRVLSYPQAPRPLPIADVSAGASSSSAVPPPAAAALDGARSEASTMFFQVLEKRTPGSMPKVAKNTRDGKTTQGDASPRIFDPGV